ncbi:AAA family ATPase [Planococcus sp. 1R117A]|uniref:AAA family ATPase n=1 Tax=Planococcus sp. 1R117A TaxID=3447020 RepID=UPI003EDC2C71
MKLILLFGPQATGKMTIGKELEKITGLKLFHNHMTIELLHPFFGFSSEMWRLSNLFRAEIFKALSKSEMNGIIFTYVWAFDMEEDWDFVRKTCEIFESNGNEVYFVELEAETEIRIERNKSASRLKEKPTKRNIEESERELLDSMKKYRLNSLEGEIEYENYIRIDNSNLQPDKVAHLIKEKFSF